MYTIGYVNKGESIYICIESNDGEFFYDILIDKFDNSQTIKTEKQLRDIYFEHIEEILFNWRDSRDNEILENLKKERDEVYTCDFSRVKKVLEEDNWYYEIKEIEVI